MKAYLLPKGIKSPKELKRIERPDPKPGTKEILVRMRAASLNYRDQAIARGTYGGSAGVEIEAIPLSDGAGEVVAIGLGVSRFKVGDRIAGTFNQGWVAGPYADIAYPSLGQSGVDGVLAELVVFDEEDAVRVPKGLSYEEASCLPCAALTAWSSLVVAGDMKAGQSVLTLGTGGVSVFAIQFAKAAGCFVIATSSSDEKLQKAKALGADVLINYKTTPDWDGPVRAATGGRGVDHVVEIGGAGTLGKSAKALANNGCIGLIGFLAGRADGTGPTLPRWGKMVRIGVGSRVGFEDMNRAIEASRIKPVIDKVFPFDQAVEAYDYEYAGKHFGKVVIAI